MRGHIFWSGMALASLLLATPLLMAQEKKDKAGAQEQFGNPGEVHKRMARLAGEYTTVTKATLMPGAAPQETKGTAKITAVLGGRFLSEENSGEMFGRPFSGLRLFGYNNGTQQFEATWTYTGSTALMALTGTSKDDGKTINWVATFEQEKGVKITLYVNTTVVDDDQLVVELYRKNPDGSKGTTLETTYTRKK